MFLPFLFKYYLFSHFPDEIKLLFHIIPSLLPEKNHVISYIILVGQKKKTKISLLLRSKKSILWHFSENPTKRKTDIKKLITSANERNKAHFKGV